jgi:hypothetical protein
MAANDGDDLELGRGAQGLGGEHRVYRAGVADVDIVGVDAEMRARDIRCEVWKSDECREERHFFIVDPDKSQNGYQGDRRYLFGCNPELVSEKIVETILKLIEASL